MDTMKDAMCNVELKAFEIVDKTVKPAGHSGRIYLPKTWVGKRVKVVLLEELEES
jgi:putative transposon-encoded protein